MEENTTYHYVLFPCPFCRWCLKSRKRPSQTFSIMAYRSALTLEISPENAFKEAVYCYFRNKLTQALTSQFSKLHEQGKVFLGPYYKGFDSSGFNPEGALQGLRDLRDPELKKDILEFYRLARMQALVGTELDLDKVIFIYHWYTDLYGDFEGQPLVMMPVRMMQDFIHGEKSEFEYLLFAAYAAIRSMTGQKHFAATTKGMIFCRMFGAKNRTELARMLEDERIQAVYQKYNKRYYKDKILDHLLARRFLSAKIWFKNRLYVSAKYGYEELAEKVKEYVNQRHMKERIQADKARELEVKLELFQSNLQSNLQSNGK